MIWVAAYLGSVVGALLTVIAMVSMRRGEQSNVGRIGWMALVLLSPPIGLVLFLLFGGKKLSAEHRDRSPIELAACPEWEVDETSRVTDYLTHRGMPAPTNANYMRPISDPVELDNALFELIDSATKTLYVMTFILNNDAIRDRLIHRLCEKAREGVQVRLLVDGLGSLFLESEALERLRDAGGDAATFKPLSHLSRFAYVNLRNHRKLVVVDGHRALLGGANWVDEEVTQHPDSKTWIDLTLYLEGVVAFHLHHVFRSDWEFVTEQWLPRAEAQECRQPADQRVAMQIIPVGPDGPIDILDDLWQLAIHDARKCIRIITPYFIPPPLAMQSLEIACRRGVDVQILMPSRTDVRAADYARLDYLRSLEEVGATILRYPHRMIHAKVIVVDDRVAFAGSANFDMRSFFLNYELVAVIHEKRSINEILAFYQSLAKDCVRGSHADTMWRRFVGTAARMFASEM